MTALSAAPTPDDVDADRAEAFTQRLRRSEADLVDAFAAQHGWTRQHALRVLAMRQLGQPDPVPLKPGRPRASRRGRRSHSQEVLSI